MKNQWFLLSLLATFLSFISCSKDDPFPTDEEDDMSFVHSVTVGDNAYVSLFKDLNVEQTSTQNSLVFAKESFLFTYGGNIYVLESMNARLYKYRVENGLLIQEKETMILPSGHIIHYIVIQLKTIIWKILYIIIFKNYFQIKSFIIKMIMIIFQSIFSTIF